MATASTPFPWRAYLAPRYWRTWVALGMLRIAAMLPFRLQLAVGRIAGRFAYHLMPQRRAVAAVNLELCFPELGAHARRRLLRAHFESLGIGLVEVGCSWWTPDEVVRARVAVSGLEYLEQAKADGVPAILLSAHFTTLEIGGHVLSQLAPISVMYRRNDNALLEELIQRHRRRRVASAIHRDSVKDMLRALKRGEAVWYAPDQNYRRSNSALVPFFGHPTPTNTATSRLAQISGARVIPFAVARLPGVQGYQLTLHPPLADFPTGDAFADTIRVNGILEEQVRAVPEQYLWIHRRFKVPVGTGGDPYEDAS
ncbi:MAG: LpxL/LpxP family Kdo(2)-lipid IV(A) lauroyl/palmitoleoyl acyltransferase [Xanthomonadaceae bacterium]|nr:LpxL/LpxP family Kdo(2)-lipid IV(A) lauroyl/palmitoleoyl acyltransferase [Xanthomonadaceae bacterium]